MAEDIFGAYYRRSAARFPHYANKTSRTSSFIGWPADKSQTAEYLAEGGFYYAGKDDCTRCFYCGGGLRNWLPGDDPVVEHARWFPDCKYILVKKGKQWVDRVPIDHPRHYESNDTDVSEQVQKSKDLDEMIERIINKPCGKALLFLGYSSDIVRAAITSLLSSSDWDESLVTTKALGEIAIDMEEESTSDSEKENLPTAGEIEELKGAVGGVSMEDVGSISLEYSHQVPVEAQTGIEDENMKKLKEENLELRHQMKCKICLEKDISMMFLPCGHFVTCEDCSKVINKCPVCRAKVAAKVKTFL